MLDKKIYNQLHEGVVIPAHPLALTENRKVDEKRQKGLTRYYMQAGAGGVAVGVHTTQFEIRKPKFNLYETVLEIAAEEIRKANLDRPFIKIAGICGPSDQALIEAEIAMRYGYHLGLVSLGGLEDYSEDDLIQHVQKIAERIPVFGFYLQPAVGGQILSYRFWKKFAEISNMYAIKVAAFNRYQTLDVVRAVTESSRNDEIALYTGNDDNIIFDLLTPYQFEKDGKKVEKGFAGGLLGQWAVWTSKAVEMLEKIKQLKVKDQIPTEWLARAIQLTDANAVVFDAENNFKGCIPGIHEVLRRQGLLDGRWCLNKDEKLSPGQDEELDRIYRSYAYLTDDQFVEEHLDEFLSE